jgi:hypothetical protein
MELKNKIDSKKKLLYLNVGQLQKDILNYINNIRANPITYYESLKREYPFPSLEIYNLLKFIYSLKNIKLPPLKLDNDICKCSEDILSYIILYDEGKDEINFGPNDKENYSLKRRLERIGKINVDNEEYIIFGMDNPKSIIKDLLLNDPNMEKLLDNKFTLVGISCGILPSDRLCTIIDIVEEEKFFDSFRKKGYYNIYEKGINLKDNFSKMNYHNNNINNNIYSRRTKNKSFSSGRIIYDNKNGNIKSINNNNNNNFPLENYYSNNPHYELSINSINKKVQEENPMITFSTQTENTYKSDIYNNDNVYKIQNNEYKVNINKNGIPYLNKNSKLLHQRNLSYSNIRIPHLKKYNKNYSTSNINNSNNLKNKNNNFNYNLKLQSSVKSLFNKNIDQEKNITYTRSIIPDIDGTFINVLTRNTQFKDGSKLIEYDTK